MEFDSFYNCIKLVQQQFYQTKLTINESNVSPTTTTTTESITKIKCEIDRNVSPEDIDIINEIIDIKLDNIDISLCDNDMSLSENDQSLIHHNENLIIYPKQKIKIKKTKKSKSKKPIEKLSNEINTKERYSAKSNSKYIDEQIKSFYQMKCEICESHFETFAEAVRHYDDKHKQSAFITCCGKKYFHRIRLFDHLMEHTNPDGIYRYLRNI